MYFKKNVVKARGNAGAAAPKEPNVTIIASDDILSWPNRDGNGVNHLGSFVMKPNARMYTFYMTPSSIKAPVDAVGDEDAEAFMHKFEGESPGNDLELAEAVQNWTGVNCIIIHGSCSDPYRKVQGTKCSPLKMKASLQDDKDGRKWKLAFESHVATAYLPGHYTGALVFADPYVVPLTSAVELIAANGEQYKLPFLSVTTAVLFSEVSLENGTIVTLIGGGGTNPATLTNGVTDKRAALINGTTWIGYEGAVINLRVFNNGTSVILIEVSRS